MSAGGSRAERPELPRWLRVGYGVWFVVWLAAYWAYFGWQFVLWFCCLANVYALLGCITQRPLWFSLAALAALGVQLVYALDLVALLGVGKSPTGATAYMFDASRPLLLRGLSLFHVWMPALMLYAIYKLGYEPRALWIQTLVALCVLPACYLLFDPSVDTNDLAMPRVLLRPFDRDFNINWVHAFYDRPEPGIGARRLWTMLIGYPLLVHVPTHLLLSTRARARP
jgi:hypothetical protein